MPELPEVEIVARGLQRLQGQVLQSFSVFDPKVLFESQIATKDFIGRRLQRVYRHGKYIVYSFRDQTFIVQHLRMTGKVLDCSSSAIPLHLVSPWGSSKQIRYRMDFDKDHICFWDTRRFGTITAIKNLETFWQTKKYAPDPLGDSQRALAVFHAGIAGANRPVKTALLDQSIAAGTGNIYADEALHRVKIHPKRRASSLSLLEREKLFVALTKLFTAAIDAGGTTANNYLNAAGIPGDYAKKLKVYGRKGERCLTCRSGTIERIVLGGRATHFCLICQPSKRVKT